MITQEEFIMIHELKKQGYSIRAISRITGKDRKTIARHLKNDELLSIKRTIGKPSKLDEFKEFILERISKTIARIPAIVILKEIRELGYKGRLRILQEFLKLEYAKRVKEDPVVRFETAPGYQAQVDWTTIRHGKSPIYAFVMTMGYSRASFVMFTTSMSEEVLIDCHEQAFAFFGGITKTILYDNMKTVIDKRDAYGNNEHRFNPAFTSFAKHHGFTIKLCKPYRAKTKGKVERFNHYLKSNFYRPLVAKLSGSNLEVTVALLNSYIHKWLYEANTRIHGTTNKRPDDLLNDELSLLLPFVQMAKPILPQTVRAMNLGLLPDLTVVAISQPPLASYDRLVGV